MSAGVVLPRHMRASWAAHPPTEGPRMRPYSASSGGLNALQTCTMTRRNPKRSCSVAYMIMIMIVQLNVIILRPNVYIIT